LVLNSGKQYRNDSEGVAASQNDRPIVVVGNSNNSFGNYLKNKSFKRQS
jgi:hypothetical protein